jgi:hypothetical protein
MSAYLRVIAPSLCLAASCLLAGCESLGQQQARFASKSTDNDSSSRTLKSERQRYQVDRDPVAARWLLTHCVHTSMTVAEVNGVFGEDGTRVYNDARIKKGTDYREDDVIYRWGPDKNGRNIYLVFRNGRVYNFDPKDYDKEFE